MPVFDIDLEVTSVYIHIKTGVRHFIINQKTYARLDGYVRPLRTHHQPNLICPLSLNY